MRYLTLVIGILITSLAQAQTAPDKYWVQFTDKNDSPFSISAPEQFLSYRAIDRRNRHSISVNEQDLPVNPQYIEAVTDLGASLIHRSKWFNGITIFTQDIGVLDAIRALEFVRSIKSVKSLYHALPDETADYLPLPDLPGKHLKTDTTIFNYGLGSNQIGMLNGHILHNQGFQGQGMVIAILDGGFTAVNENPAFDSLWANNQILGGWDFVDGVPIRFTQHSHGSHVLSTIAANMPGQLVGTAPKASFYLLRTEFGASEYPIEEDHWIAGAEYADSVGADLITSSLSYTTYWEPFADLSYEDLDGNTARVTRGADIAASKGILVLNSAGNSGNKDWHYIGAPADGDSVFAIGAVNSEGYYAPFSSTGPSVDGRVKPNVVAQGQDVVLASSTGEVFTGNGTSFSTPIVAGLAACLWQSNKGLSNMMIANSIEQSASQYNSPDSLLGFGLPDFSRAFFIVQGIDSIEIGDEKILRTFPNPFTNHLSIDFFSERPTPFELSIIDFHGRIVYKKDFEPGYINFHRLRLTELTDLGTGAYFLRITSEQGQYTTKIVKTTN